MNDYVTILAFPFCLINQKTNFDLKIVILSPKNLSKMLTGNNVLFKSNNIKLEKKEIMKF